MVEFNVGDRVRVKETGIAPNIKPGFFGTVIEEGDPVVVIFNLFEPLYCLTKYLDKVDTLEIDLGRFDDETIDEIRDFVDSLPKRQAPPNGEEYIWIDNITGVEITPSVLAAYKGNDEYVFLHPRRGVAWTQESKNIHEWRTAKVM